MDKLKELFNLPDIVPEEVSDTTNVPATLMNHTETDGDDSEMDSDFDLARRTLRKLVETSSDTLDEAILLAKNSEHPRAYEVVGQIMKTVSEVSKDLLTLREQKQKIVSSMGTKKEPDTIRQQNNIVFAGSTQDLLNMIEQKKKDSI